MGVAVGSGVGVGVIAAGMGVATAENTTCCGSGVISGVGSGVGDGVGSGAAVGSGVAVGAAVASGVGAGLGLGDKPQAVRSAHASANIRKKEIDLFVAGVLSPAVEAGGFGDIIGRLEVGRQGAVFIASL